MMTSGGWGSGWRYSEEKQMSKGSEARKGGQEGWKEVKEERRICEIEDPQGEQLEGRDMYKIRDE